MFRSHIQKKLQQGQVIATRIPAATKNHQAWIGVRPLDSSIFERPYGTIHRVSRRHGGEAALKKLQSSGGQIYLLRAFELSNDYIENEWDVIEEDLTNLKEFVEADLESLYARIQELGGQPEEFVGARVCDYPM